MHNTRISEFPRLIADIDRRFVTVKELEGCSFICLDSSKLYALHIHHSPCILRDRKAEVRYDTARAHTARAHTARARTERAHDPNTRVSSSSLTCTSGQVDGHMWA